MKKALVALAATTMILLAGCNNPPPGGGTDTVEVTLPNGGTVSCVLYDDSNTGTEMDCIEATYKAKQLP
jgi:hypothetical protein